MDVPPATPGACGHRPPPPQTLATDAPDGHRVLAVEGDEATRNALETILRRLGYAVTPCSHPVVAMAVLRDRRGEFDFVVIDVSADAAAVLELFEFVDGEMRLPAYALSIDGNKEHTMVVWGPLTREVLEILRPSITSRMSMASKSPEASPNGKSNGSTATASTVTAVSSSRRRATKRRWRRRRRSQEREATSQEVEQDNQHGGKQQQPEQQHVEEQQQQEQSPKRPRLVWTNELHLKFVEAHDKLLPSGDDVPKKILKLMNDPTLTRENVASHLQKYRSSLKQGEPHVRQRGKPIKKHRRDSLAQPHNTNQVAPASFTTPNTSHQNMLHCQPVQTPPPPVAFTTPNTSHQHMMHCQPVQRSPNAQCNTNLPLIVQLSSMMTQPCYMPPTAFVVPTVIQGLPTCSMQNHLSDLHIQASQAVSINEKSMAPKEQIEHAPVAEAEPVIIGSLSNSDGSSREDFSDTFQQTMKDSEPSWDYEFLKRFD